MGAAESAPVLPELIPECVLRVLPFVPWAERDGAVRANPAFARALALEDPDAAYWRTLCHRLAADAGLFLPEQLERTDGWKAVFLALWAVRQTFAPPGIFREEAPGVRRFRLQAMCRFRPTTRRTATGAKVALPLHQRIALLQGQDPELSRHEALHQLMAEQQELAAEEKENGFSAQVLNVTGGPCGSALTVTPGSGLRTFAFDHLFADATQEEVFATCGFPVCWDFVNGTHGALIVYGQTGSGKTHTMFGPPALRSDRDKGVAQRSADFVLAALAARRSAGVEAQLSVSYVEVYGNDTTDLLSDAPIGANRGANQRMGHRYVLEGKVEHPVESAAELYALLAAGDERKRCAATAMNDRSTRAHTLLILRLRQRTPAGADVESMLFLADLGGSEKVLKSGAHETVKAPGAIDAGEDEEVARVTWAEYYAARQRLTEASHINKGLLVLKRCIAALRGSKSMRVPFYDAKLTQLLEPALGGPARTSVVVCCSQEPDHAEETVQTLRFGESCRLVERSGPDPVSQAVKAAVAVLDAEVKEVEKAIATKERWETRVTIRKDVVSEMDRGGTELKTEEEMELGGFGAVVFGADDGTSTQHVLEHEVVGQVLVGAEAERTKLEALLAKRRRLLGEA